MFRGLWQRIARLFGGGSKERTPGGGIPAPETLVAKVANVKNKDRDILRVAGEAIRRGHPDQAVIAYWKAVQVYLRDGQLLKAISALKMILQHSPEDLEAFHALADAYEALDRKRDAANTCLWIADIHARRSQRNEALAILYRSMELDPMVKGARERIQALGGELPMAAREPSYRSSAPGLPPSSLDRSKQGPPLRLQSKQETPARPPSQMVQQPPKQEQRPASKLASAPAAPAPAPSQPARPASMQGPAIVGLPPVSRPAPPAELPEEELMEMPGDPIVDDDDKLELDIEGDDALDFPDDSLVLPVTEAKPAPMLTEPTPDPELSTAPELDEPDEYVAAADYDEPEAASEGDPDAMTIAMAAVDTDVGAATIAMKAISDDGEVMSEDLANDATMLAMEAPPWDGPTDEHGTVDPENSFEESTDPPAERPVRRFAIPTAATTVDINPPSAMKDSEHDPERPAPKVGIPGESTRAYSVEELRRLGVKPPDE